MPMAVLLVLNVVVCRAITLAITTVQTCFTVVRVFGYTKFVQLSILTSVMESSKVFLLLRAVCRTFTCSVKFHHQVRVPRHLGKGHSYLYGDFPVTCEATTAGIDAIDPRSCSESAHINVHYILVVCHCQWAIDTNSVTRITHRM